MAFNKETEMYEGFIYCITNKINNKKYIGQTTTTIKHRFKQHIESAKRSNYAIGCAIRKYGKENFSVEEIEKITRKSRENLVKGLSVLEKKYIKEYKSLTNQHGYNIDIGGASCSYCCKPVDKYSMDGKLQQSYMSASDAVRSVGKSEKEASCILSVCKGKCLHMYGFVWRYHGDLFDKYPLNRIYNNKPVDQYTKDGIYVDSYDSAKNAAKNLSSKNYGYITNCCKGNLMTAFGYVWRYKDEPFNKYPSKRIYTNNKPVDQYTTDGIYITSYDSVKSASKIFGLKYSNTISSCCRGEIKTALDYVWRYKGESFNKFNSNPYNRCKINQYTSDNIFIKTHLSIIDAKNEINIKYYNRITKCCKGEQKTCGGYKWYFANDPTQPDKSKIIA